MRHFLKMSLVSGRCSWSCKILRELSILRFGRADLGRISYFGLATFRRVAHTFLSENVQLNFPANVSALFLEGFSPLTQKFTPKIVGIPLQFQSLSQKTFSRRFYAYGRDQDLARGDHPNSWKNAPRMHGQMKIFHVGSHQLRESLWELLQELRFSYCSSRGMPSREWNFVFREWDFEFRELLREYPGILRELREWPFTPRAFFAWNWDGPQTSDKNYNSLLFWGGVAFQLHRWGR